MSVVRASINLRATLKERNAIRTQRALQVKACMVHLPLLLENVKRVDTCLTQLPTMRANV